MSLVASLARRTLLFLARTILGWLRRRAVTFGVALGRRIWARRGNLFATIRGRRRAAPGASHGGPEPAQRPFTRPPRRAAKRGLLARGAALLTSPFSWRRRAWRRDGPAPARPLAWLRRDPWARPRRSLFDRGRRLGARLVAASGARDFANDRAAKGLQWTFDALGLSLAVERVRPHEGADPGLGVAGGIRDHGRQQA
jgi:hypothetical protein